MSASQEPLPTFVDPPVIEAVLGVQFAPLQQLSILHFGIYWAQIQEAYPHQEIKPALVPAIEEFERQPGSEAIVRFGPVSEPELRCWFIDSGSTRLIQTQKDRFIRNWRKVKPEDSYPHYDILKPEFQAEWERFCGFLQQSGLGVPEVNQCEVTYVNHIEIGKGWESPGEAHKVIRLVSDTSTADLLKQPELVRMNTSYAFPNNKGRLHIAAQPAISQHLAKEVLQLTLTARGRPDSSDLPGVLEWFDLGHEWVVRGFADLTTPQMHKVWRRTS